MAVKRLIGTIIFGKNNALYIPFRFGELSSTLETHD